MELKLNNEEGESETIRQDWDEKITMDTRNITQKYIKKEDVKRRAGIEGIVKNVPKLWSWN